MHKATEEQNTKNQHTFPTDRIVLFQFLFCLMFVEAVVKLI